MQIEQIEVLPDDLELTGKKIKFFRADGTPAENSVGMCGEDRDGNVCFFELLGVLDDGKIDGKAKFKRILIRRVFPYVPGDDEEVQDVRLAAVDEGRKKSQ